jgi:hypothetical protein
MLVKEIQDKIYEYLNLFELEKKKIIHQLNMISVWRNHIMYNCKNNFIDIMLNKIFFLSCNDWIWLYNKTNRKIYFSYISLLSDIRLV